MRLAEKAVIREEGRISRVPRSAGARVPRSAGHECDAASTLPRLLWDRLCAAGGISKEGQEELALLRQMINPRQLKREIYDSLHRIFMLPNATSGVTDAASVCIRPRVLLRSHRKEEAAQ